MIRLAMSIATALALLPASLARAADVAVFTTSAVNVRQPEAEAVATVLAAEYARVAGVRVIGPRQAALALEKDRNPAAAARSLGVAEYIEVSTIGLWSNDLTLESDQAGTRLSTDARIIVQAARYADGGALVYRAEMTGASMADIEIVAQRLARALHEKKAPEATQTIHTVTRREAIPENRVWTEKVMGLKTSMAAALAQGQALDPVITLGFDGRLEGQSYFLEFGASLALPADTDRKGSHGYGGVFAELGGSYYLADDGVSPYIGGGVAPRILMDSNDGGVKMAAYGQVGLMFARQSSTRLYVDLRVTQNLVPLEKYVDQTTDYYGYPYTESVATGESIYPTEVGLEVGIGW